MAFTDLVERAEEALLARTLTGRRLERPVHADGGAVVWPPGVEIDQAMLDAARERGLLEAVAAAAEPGTSDTELEELVRWIKARK